MSREFQPVSRLQSLLLLCRLALPMFMVAYVLTLAGKVLLLLFGLGEQGAMGFFLAPVPDIAFVIAAVIAFGLSEGIAVVIAFGLSEGIAVVIAGGIAFGPAVGTAVGIAGVIMTGLAVSIAVGLLVGLAVDLAVGLTLGIGFLLGLYRVPFYVISGSSALYTYLAGRNRPHAALRLLRRSSLHWDERVYLPLPLLKQTLLLAYDVWPQEVLAEIAFIAAERPLQLRAARAATLEIVMRDLEERTTIRQIAGLTHHLQELLPPETTLSDPRWARALPLVDAASREAMRSLQPFGRQARLTALDDMAGNLQKIRPSVAFQDQHLNQRLRQVINTWLAAVQTERVRLEQLAPGMVLYLSLRVGKGESRKKRAKAG